MTGKVAVVTGAASGIGRASAEVLAAAGARVVVADLDEEGAAAVAAGIGKEGGEAVAHQVDVADPGAVDALADAAVSGFGQLDVLVNNAGIMLRRPLTEVSPEEFDRVLSVNLKSILYGGQAAARVMRPGSSIVNTLSTIIDFATPGTGSYAASKKAGEALTRTFAVELGPRGIRVNGVAPGWTDTGITRQRHVADSGEFQQGRFDELAHKMATASPLGTVAEAIDSAHAVLYLASEASRCVTGHVIRVNGGASMS
ncbi:SDR family oxidoreductase [Streptomyces sp. NBC_01239]|uniref:SDR family NAD(P)-dependent oxidoreductase n=1 Tax=Streptomyces sp. NBC_01239 TaxID=2903792 RepID=UPI00225A90AB|nr:SDR family oxidoreductase [Streptomyces sp. NBC_01239]MCX4815214.1 SDR family oxidoreductase [Streptomyces sp. NBC_01239]